MRRMRLGKTGLNVTQLGLGGIQIARLSPEEAVRIVRTGLDLGIGFLETARGYGDSEEKVGRAIRGRRESVVIASKAGAASAREMREKIEKSLKALGTDYIDLYQFHGCDKKETYQQMTAPGGALEALLAAKEAGQIRSTGFSSHHLNLALEMIGDDRFASAQVPISFMNTENHEKGLFERARAQDVGLIAMKPFGGGRLGNARLCMGYVLSLPDVAIAAGVDSVEHVRELVRLAENPPVLGEEDRREMQRIKDKIGTRFCRACNYCQPCPQKIPIFQVLWTPVYMAQMGVEHILAEDRIKRVRQSANCTACRECEKRCPFGLEIVKGLEECRSLVERLAAEHAACSRSGASGSRA